MSSSNTIKTELVVIGAGPGGYVAAIRAAQLNKKVVLVDKDKLGGVCLNYGCIPSKAMIYASDFLDKIKKSSNMGINVENVTMNFLKMQEWKDNIIEKLNSGINLLCKENKIDIVKGTASFETSNKLKITVGNDFSFIDFENAIIATGSRPIEIPSLKFDKKIVISSTEALCLDEVPKNLVVVGGGYIGLELGTAYAKLGSKVSVIEMDDQLLPGFNQDIVEVIQRKLESVNVDIYLNSQADRLKNNKIIINSKDKGEISLDADKILVAVGRYPNTKNLELKNTKILIDNKGFIKVDKNLKTKNSNIYAIGDVSVGPMLAHKASHQGKFVAECISGKKENYDHATVPSVIFTDPEIATVGLSEEDAQGKGIKTIIGRFPFRISSRAMTRSETDGFVKIIANKKDNKILGVEIVGAEASDLISEAALAIKKGSTVEDLASTIHPHPTLSESLMEAAEATMGKAIHIFNPK